MGFIRTLVLLAIIVGLAYCGATVKLGKRTFFGHVRAIWHSEETRDLVEGVKERGAPVVKKVTRGVEKGIDEVRKPDIDAGAHAPR